MQNFGGLHKYLLSLNIKHKPSWTSPCNVDTKSSLKSSTCNDPQKAFWGDEQIRGTYPLPNHSFWIHRKRGICIMYGTVWIHWIENKQKPILSLIYIVFMSRRITMTGRHIYGSLLILMWGPSTETDGRTDRQNNGVVWMRSQSKLLGHPPTWS